MANRKLLIIDAAEALNDLRVPPGNRLEQLRGDRAGQHSIRINDQWRICFTWTAAGAAEVEITDSPTSLAMIVVAVSRLGCSGVARPSTHLPPPAASRTISADAQMDRTLPR